MKIIFLDMDGVMNSHAYLTANEKRRERKKTPLDIRGTEGWSEMVDPKGVERLNRVIAATNARVVISSSWRHVHTPIAMQKILELRGFRGRVIDETPVLPGARGTEITAWLDEHPGIDRYVIFDDGSSAGHGHDGRFVNTSLATGLTDSDVREAVRILGRAE